MLLKEPAQLDHQSLDPDCVLIVGAGAVGLHLAVQLVARGRQVVVLEAGGLALDSFSSDAFEVVGRRHDGVGIGRSVALGGTSNLWGGQLVEFMPIDVDGRSWLPGARWPIKHEDLARYYGATYEACGVDAEFHIDEPVWSGIQKEPPEFGEDIEVFLTRWMKTPSLARLHAEQIDNDPRLIVVLGSKTVGFVGDGDRMRGVRIVDAGRVERVVEGSDVVLAAGTLENARLMLHAAADESWDCPWRGNDNLGRCFQDHLGGRVANIRPRDKKAFFDLFCTVVYRGHKFQPKVRFTNAVLQQQSLLNCQAMIGFESSVSENLVFLKQFVKAAIYSRKIGSISEFFKSAWACSRHMIPLMWKFVVEHRILIPSGSRISLIVQSEVEPLRESRITIDPSHTDRFGLPRLVLDWQLSGREFEAIAAFTRRTADALSEAGLADLDIEAKLEAGDPTFLDELHDTNHHAGGCVVGTSSEDGVVDRDLRVFGTENLFVAGASVFRCSSNANTTFTAMTLATRLADHLAETRHATC